MDRNRLSHILDNATSGSPLSHEEMAYLLSLTEPEAIQMVMAAARRVREHHFGNRLFLYGFIFTEKEPKRAPATEKAWKKWWKPLSCWLMQGFIL